MNEPPAGLLACAAQQPLVLGPVQAAGLFLGVVSLTDTVGRSEGASEAERLKRYARMRMLVSDSFRRAGVNLTRLLSRPIIGQPKAYLFFVDVAGHQVAGQ